MRNKLLLLLLLSVQIAAYCQDFTFYGVNYTVISEAERTCRTKAGSYTPTSVGFSVAWGNNIKGELILPEKVYYEDREYTVVEIGDFSFSYNSITGPLSLPNTLISIGKWAFYGCNQITGSLVIGDNVTRIGNSAFVRCTGLNGSLTIGNNIEEIGDSAFYRLYALNGSLNLDNNLRTIGKSAFRECTGFNGSLTIGDNIQTIGERAFEDCSGFTGSLTIDAQDIGNWAFFGCTGFNGSLTLGKNVESIGQAAFYDCGFTGSLTIPNSVQEIEENTFYGCKGFTGSLTIPNSVHTIGESAFDGCSGFTGTLTIPNSVTSIGERAFRDCSGFTGSLTIPESVTSIRTSAFYGCSGFTGSLIIGNNVESIGERAFYDCSGFTGSLILGEKVQSMQSNTFDYSVNFKNVISLSASPPYISLGTFYDLYQKDLFVPKESIDLYKSNYYWRRFSNINPIEISEISLNKSNLNLLIGQEETLEVDIVPQYSSAIIEWSVDEAGKSIVSVNQSGKVTALAAGVATITATVDNVSASCIVTVKDGGDITVKPGAGTGDDSGEDGDNGFVDGKDVMVHVNRSITINIELPEGISEAPTLTWSLAQGGEMFVTLNPSPNTLSATFTGVSIGNTSYIVTLNGVELFSGKVNVVAEVTMKSVHLDPAELTLAQNAQSVQLKAIVTPDGATMTEFDWSSSQPSVATVSNTGLVTPLGQGQTIITATALDGSGLSATSTVTVTAPIDEDFEFEFDESVMGGKEGISLYIGDTYQFVPKAMEGYVLPEVINWTSSDDKTVSVTDAGLVTAIALGEATITASATVNGKEVKATCEVTVVTPDEPTPGPDPDPVVSPADTPTQLLRKGDGASHTFVVMMEKSDNVLEADGYHYVFGYSNAAEGDVTLGDTPWRYTFTTENIYWKSANDFWVFAYYIDDEGKMHVSSRRHLDGSVDDDFNPLDFIGNRSRSGEHIVGIYNKDGQYMGRDIDVLESGIYIIKTTNSSYKIIK
ncbi:MAG: leucine-rich repeat protein [Muribaculaceae bacterium]|nr:leucine-rich repeat protein [Muribaculaceae bacterium]